MPVAVPDPKLVQSPAVVLARHDVLVIHGEAPSCHRDIQGSGFVFAPHRIMTNAHVVAGVRQLTVSQSDGTTYDATVVLYDSQRDIAVLAVPDLQVQPMAFAPAVGSGANAVVVGYPEGGPFTPVPARVRERIRGPAARTSTSPPRSPARSTRSTRGCSQATPAALGPRRPAACWAWSSRSRSTTARRGTR